jgi:hypothetical protein
MYYTIVILLMFAFPFGSVCVEKWLFAADAGLLFLIGKWFAFWAVGVRLFIAGLRQATGPEYTARKIFEFKTDEPLPIIQELGFANLAIGLVGIVSVANRTWLMPAAVAGGLFYGLAGIKHVMRKNRNRIENVAMISDLFVFVALLAFVAGSMM